MQTERQELTLRHLVTLFAKCKSVATPHRTPNFKLIATYAESGFDTPVHGILVFIEEHNTGYDGILERWMFYVPKKDITSEDGTTHGYATHFQCDLLPHQIHTEA